MSGASGLRSSMSSLFVLLSSSSRLNTSTSHLPSTTSLSSPPHLGMKPAHPRRRAFFFLKFCNFVVSAQLGEKQGIQKRSDDRVQVPRHLDPGDGMKHGVHQYRTWQWHRQVESTQAPAFNGNQQAETLTYFTIYLRTTIPWRRTPLRARRYSSSLSSDSEQLASLDSVT